MTVFKTFFRASRQDFNVNLTASKFTFKWWNNFIKKGCICDWINEHNETIYFGESFKLRLRVQLQIVNIKSYPRVRCLLRFCLSAVLILKIVRGLKVAPSRERVQLCNYNREFIKIDDNQLSIIIFKDEVIFYLSIKFNKNDLRL